MRVHFGGHKDIQSVTGYKLPACILNAGLRASGGGESYGQEARNKHGHVGFRFLWCSGLNN